MLHDGTVEGLKGLGLVAMTADHVDAFLLARTWPAGFALGRLALPIFVIVLAYNLARSGAHTPGRYQRVLIRLLVAGVLASPFYIALGGPIVGGWPLNSLFALALMTRVLWGWLGSPRRRARALGLLFVGGALVEYFWIGVVLGLAAGCYVRRPTGTAAALGLAAFAGLAWLNGNDWAWMALPSLALATRLRLPIPRLRHLFYLYYPLHLATLWAIRQGMSG